MITKQELMMALGDRKTEKVAGWNDLTESAKSTIIGSLGGGLLGGLGWAIRPKDRDQNQLTEALSSILTGSTMGGIAGFGYSNLPDMGVNRAVSDSAKRLYGGMKDFLDTHGITATSRAAGTTTKSVLDDAGIPERVKNLINKARSAYNNTDFTGKADTAKEKLRKILQDAGLYDKIKSKSDRVRGYIGEKRKLFLDELHKNLEEIKRRQEAKNNPEGSTGQDDTGVSTESSPTVAPPAATLSPSTQPAQQAGTAAPVAAEKSPAKETPSVQPQVSSTNTVADVKQPGSDTVKQEVTTTDNKQGKPPAKSDTYKEQDHPWNHNPERMKLLDGFKGARYIKDKYSSKLWWVQLGKKSLKLDDIPQNMPISWDAVASIEDGTLLRNIDIGISKVNEELKNSKPPRSVRSWRGFRVEGGDKIKLYYVTNDGRLGTYSGR